jgi:hypothetical protein
MFILLSLLIIIGAIYATHLIVLVDSVFSGNQAGYHLNSERPDPYANDVYISSQQSMCVLLHNI